MLNLTRVFILVLLLINLIYNYFVPLHFDEAYYWLWSKHPALSYFDHPPMIAWLIKIATIFSAQEWFIRLVPFFCMAALGLVIWLLASQAFGEKVADLAFLLYVLIPITNLGFLLATPDAPLNLFWALCLYASYQTFFSKARHNWWLAGAGLFFGLALISKYTAVLLFPALLITSLATDNAKKLFSKGMLAAVLLAFLAFLPVLTWNYQHDWSSFVFQFRHGMAAEKIFNLNYLLEFIGGQVGVLSLFVFFGLLFSLVRYLPDNLNQDKLTFFFWPCVMPLLFFAYAALFKRSAANWPVPAYISGIILFSYWLEQKNWRKYKILSLAFSFCMLLLLRFPMLFPFLPAQLDFLDQLHGVPEMMASFSLPANSQVLSDSYANASLAAYYLPGKPSVDTFQSPRITMFDYWRQEQNLPERIIYLGEKDERENLQKIYKFVQRRADLEYTGKYKRKTFCVYEAWELNP